MSTKKEKPCCEKCSCECTSTSLPRPHCNAPYCPCHQSEVIPNMACGVTDQMLGASESVEWEKEWVEKKKEILGLFNAGQSHLLTQNGSVTLSAGQQREEGEYNCRDAQKAVERTEQFFLKAIASAVEAMKVDRDDSWRACLQKLAWKKEEIDDATGWVDRTPLRLRSNHEL